MIAHQPKDRTVIYDLDGVVTFKDTFGALLTERLRSSPGRLVRALPTAVSWATARRPEQRAFAARNLARIALSGMRDVEYAEYSRTIGRRIAHDPAWIRADIVRRIRFQHANGTRIIIATASEARLARALLQAAGVPFHVLSASVLVATATGMDVGDHRVGARKAEALLAAGVRIAEAEFVTDSRTDLPTARLAAEVTLVGPSLTTRRAFKREQVPFSLWPKGHRDE